MRIKTLYKSLNGTKTNNKIHSKINKSKISLLDHKFTIKKFNIKNKYNKILSKRNHFSNQK